MNLTRRHACEPVVVTGIGVVSPNGVGCEAFTNALLAGRSGLSRPTFEGPFAERLKLRTSSVGAVCDFDPSAVMDETELRRVPRLIPMALAASREAIAMARLPIELLDDQRRTAVVLGTGGGGLAFVEQQYQLMFAENGRASLFSITAGTHGNLSSELSIQLGLRGPSHVVSTGCTSSTDALGYARLLIRSGQADRVVVGGADSPIAPGILSAFEKMQVVSTRRWDDPRQSSRPFDVERDGFVLGEGAWMFVLESAESSHGRSATILAELAGYGSTCDAYHRVRIAPDAAESARAIQLALADADATPAQLDYANLHGTSTDMNDRLETVALKAALGETVARSLPMSSTKSMIGHPQGACGAAGVAATILCGRRGHVHPTANLTDPGDGCDLDYVPGAVRERRVSVALCNCIAFGSKNSAIVLRLP
ncbi:MAG: beta-ketoacyl-[acyl-carrier-protein] synthase family protein [Tepidisphaeraceae bacterium]